jgi:hypothetical protein
MKKLIFIILFLWGCSSPEKLLQKAIDRGAKVTTDTVFQDVITERTITDTLVHFQTVHKLLAGDTVTINTVRWRLRERIDTVTKTRYVQVECKPDTIRVIQAVNTTISAGHSDWRVVGYVFGALFFCGAMGYGAYRLAGIVRK